MDAPFDDSVPSKRFERPDEYYLPRKKKPVMCRECGKRIPRKQANRGRKTCKRCKVKLAVKRRAEFQDMRAILVSYADRKEALKKMGFETYTDYLKSPMWTAVKAKAFRIKGSVCVICSKNATQFHHADYSIRTLTGESVTDLHPVCRPCHENIELDGDRKRTFQEALERFLFLLDGDPNAPF